MWSPGHDSLNDMLSGFFEGKVACSFEVNVHNTYHREVNHGKGRMKNVDFYTSQFKHENPSELN
jgi:hypothetical protein